MSIPRSTPRRSLPSRMARGAAVTVASLLVLTATAAPALAAPGDDLAAEVRRMMSESTPTLSDLPQQAQTVIVLVIGFFILAAVIVGLLMFFGGLATGAAGSRSSNPGKVEAARGRVAGGLITGAAVIASFWLIPYAFTLFA